MAESPRGSALVPILVRMMEGRVGSTLVMETLGACPAIAFDREYPFEHSHLTYLVRLLTQFARTQPEAVAMADVVYGDPRVIGPLPFSSGLVDAEAVARQGLSGIWEVFSESVRARAVTEPRGYAEKFWGPVETVVDAGLGPMVIDLVRDPRDVVASMRAFNVRHRDALFGRSQAADDEVHLRRVVAGIGLRLKEMEAPLSVPKMVLRYEDMIADPPANRVRLANFLQPVLGPEAVRCLRAPGAPAVDPTVTAAHMTASSAEASVGRWRQDLAAAEVDRIERRLGPAMARLGYGLHASG